MKVILGKKLEMTQVFAQDGKVIPVTLVQAGPCVVTDVKTDERDHYHAVVVGFGKTRRASKAQIGAWKELGAFEAVREFRADAPVEAKRGDVIDVKAFAAGDHVDVVGTSKGHGFQGVVKRHKFAGGPATHGHKDNLRMPGSIGAGGVQRVFKGRRMGGHMGTDRVTVKNLQIIQVDPEKNILAISGAVPGARGGLLLIRARDGKTVWQK